MSAIREKLIFPIIIAVVGGILLYEYERNRDNEPETQLSEGLELQITGTVFNENNQAVDNALVKFTNLGVSINTDDSGLFFINISDVNEKKINLKITVLHKEYEAYEDNIQIVNYGKRVRLDKITLYKKNNAKPPQKPVTKSPIVTEKKMQENTEPSSLGQSKNTSLIGDNSSKEVELQIREYPVMSQEKNSYKIDIVSVAGDVNSKQILIKGFITNLKTNDRVLAIKKTSVSATYMGERERLNGINFGGCSDKLCVRKLHKDSPLVLDFKFKSIEKNENEAFRDLKIAWHKGNVIHTIFRFESLPIIWK